MTEIKSPNPVPLADLTRQDAAKVCLTCANSIPVAAKFCTHCNTYQDFRRFLAFGQTSLALLIALISITGTLVPPLANRIFRDSRLEKRITSLDRTAAVFVVTNSGNMPGTVIGAEAVLPQSEANFARLALPLLPQVIEPGKSQLVNVGPSDAPALLVAKIYRSLPQDGCLLGLTFLSYGGQVERKNDPIECDRLMGNLFVEGPKAIFPGEPPITQKNQ